MKLSKQNQLKHIRTERNEHVLEQIGMQCWMFYMDERHCVFFFVDSRVMKFQHQEQELLQKFYNEHE